MIAEIRGSPKFSCAELAGPIGQGAINIILEIFFLTLTFKVEVKNGA